ncbi:MAG: hypothetical protein K2J67_12830 [Lachnospiraceae bacterium]|nr:hypothetical protein [Lachnospiraceae bacterium]
MTTAYWGLILLSAHLGCHWGMITGMAEKAFHVKPGGKRTAVVYHIRNIRKKFSNIPAI